MSSLTLTLMIFEREGGNEAGKVQASDFASNHSCPVPLQSCSTHREVDMRAATSGHSGSSNIHNTTVQ